MVFLVLLVVESFAISKKIADIKTTVVSLNKEFIECINCPTPDIYLIVADGYTSNTALKEIFM